MYFTELAFEHGTAGVQEHGERKEAQFIAYTIHQLGSINIGQKYRVDDIKRVYNGAGLFFVVDSNTHNQESIISPICCK